MTTTHRQSPHEIAAQNRAREIIAAIESGETIKTFVQRQPKSLDERFKNDVSTWTVDYIGHIAISRREAALGLAGLLAEAKYESTLQWTHSPQYCGCAGCSDVSGAERTIAYQLSRGQQPSKRLLEMAAGIR